MEKPQETASKLASRALDTSRFQLGYVTATPYPQSSGAFHVEVKTEKYPEPAIAQLHPEVHGDFYLPPEGAPVLLRELADGEFVVVKSFYNAEYLPDSIEPGERVITHPASSARVYFDSDGRVHVDGDATVVVNDGSTGVVTDVDFQNDTVTRSNDLLVP
jgi:hypothetical protein